MPNEDPHNTRESHNGPLPINSPTPSLIEHANISKFSSLLDLATTAEANSKKRFNKLFEASAPYKDVDKLFSSTQLLPWST